MRGPHAPGTLPLAYLAVFFALPVATLLVRHADINAVIDVLRDDSMRGVAWFTLWQAIAAGKPQHVANPEVVGGKPGTASR